VTDPYFRLPDSTFRGRYTRARRLDVSGQIRECVDYLQNPEILIFEFIQSFGAVESCCGPEDFSFRPPSSGEPLEDDLELTLEHFYESLEVSIVGADSEPFTCVASDLDPLPRPEDAPVEERHGLDYVGLVHAPRGGAALGAVSCDHESTPYLLLLRLLNGLAELAPRVQIERLEREITKGSLGADAVFDLHLVLWNQPDDPERTQLSLLTRDLAEVVKGGLVEAWQFPDLLRDILCLRMEASEFEGTLELDWRV
jgi:hypothetical protein